MTSVVWSLYGIIGYMNEVVVLVCKRCGHKWIPQVAEPKQCPSCRSRYWNRDYVRSDVVLRHLSDVAEEVK